jgi:DNA-3-methyladenine glycosylase I
MKRARAEKRQPTRCAWARSELMIRYHDEEWGVPVHDDDKLFEFLVLEGAQAGLSWETILNKRENYRAAFDRFDAQRVARYDSRKIAQLMRNPGIVRNRLKIASAVRNARALLQVQEEYGSFDRYIWQFVNGRPKVILRNARNPIPASTAESDAMSKDLKKRGFNFVGSTICYAFMQAVGMVDDHAEGCFRRGKGSRRTKRVPKS